MFTLCVSGAGNLPMVRKIYTTTKSNNPNVRALRAQLLPQQTWVLRWPYRSAPFSRFFPLLAIHICHPCARLPGGPPCWTHGVGPEPKMGIYELTSALTDNWMQARAKTVWCWLHVVGIRHWGEVGEAQTLSKRISILSSLAEQCEEAAPLPRGKCIYVERKHKSI